MKKEIQSECEWLEKWGKTFHQAFLDNPLRVEMQTLHYACVDAYLALRGEKMKFHSDEDLLADLGQLKKTIEMLAEKGSFNSPAIKKSHFDMIDSIIQMLSVTQPRKTEGVQMQLF